MSRYEKVKMLVSFIAVVAAYLGYRETKKVEQAKRAEIKTRTAVEIKVIKQAADIVSKRIYEGMYEGKSMDDIWTDFEFERIAIHEQ